MRELNEEAAEAFWVHGTSETDQVVARYLHAHPEAWSREHPWHPTVSVVVLDPTGTRTLLLHHPRWGWKQVGGHLEETDTTLAEGALRELQEETGTPQGAVQTLEVCTVTAFFGPMCNPRVPSGAHLDICHLVTTEESAPVHPEGHETRWWPVPEALEVVDPGARRMLQRARRAAQNSSR